MTSSDLRRRLNVTQKQLQYWCNTGLVECRHRDKHGWRDYSEAEAFLVALLAELKLRRISVARLRGFIIPPRTGEYFVVNARDSKGLWCSKDELLVCATACPGPVLVISLADIETRLYDQTEAVHSTRARD